MIAEAIVALYMAAVRPYEHSIGISNSKATGLAAYEDKAMKFLDAGASVD
jgi:hypothetical protein